MIRSLLTAAALLAVTACGTAAPASPTSPVPSAPSGRSTSPASPVPPASPAKSGTGEDRTDLEPLVKRFPALADATAARWMSGTLGDDRVPGPSTYWIDAVVTLPADVVARIAATAQPTQQVPDVVTGLRLPDGPFRTGGSLDAAFTTAGWTATAYVTGDTIVLVARGQ